MRIIAGTLGGRIFASPGGHRTHPMSDKMRGALFNSLGDISGLTVLDAFAGTGALAFEAVSRGAINAVLLENDRNAQKTIAENIELLGLENCRLVRAAAGPWLSTTQDTFDLILLDPPYDNLQPNLLERLAQRLCASGRLVLSWPGRQAPPSFEGLELVSSKQYGDSSLHFYEHKG